MVFIGWYTNGYKFTSPHDPLWLTKPTLETLVKKGNYYVNSNKDGRLIYIPRFRGRGGTSRVYGAIVRRASPDVLDLWPNGWKHKDMTDYYKKSEDHYCYYDFENVTGISKEECIKWHGRGGPMQVNSQIEEAFQNFPRTMKYICEDNEKPWNGYKHDYNGPESDRKSCSVFQQYKLRTDEHYFPTSKARKDRASKTARGSSFNGYYQHNNVKPYLIVSAPVTQIQFDGDGKAVGVSYWDKTTGEVKVANTRKEVILGAGSFDTPHLLQVSGVGSRKHLEKIGVKVVAENDHVGENLWDHISVPYVLELSKKSLELCCTNETDPIPRVNIDGVMHKTKNLESINGPFSWILHYRSNITRVPEKMSDIQLYVMGNSKLFDETGALCTSDPPEYNDQGEDPGELPDKDTIQGTIRIIDQWPEYRGSVKSVTSHIFDKPEIEYGWSYTIDGNPTKEFEKISKLFRQQVKLLREMFFGKNVRDDLKRLVVSEVAPGQDVDTDEKLDAWMRGMLVSALHPVGTCKMPECVDEFLRVKGVSNLRICDASAFATQIDGNPAATLFAMGEKLADMLKFEYSVKYIKLAIRKELSTVKTHDAHVLYPNEDVIVSKLQEQKCFDVSLTSQLISTGKDTSAVIFKCSVSCNPEVNEREIADMLVKETLGDSSKTDYCNPDNYPKFYRQEIKPLERESGPKHKEEPFVFVVWCQGYPGVHPDSLWAKAGKWRSKDGKVPGSEISFKLNCQERIRSILQYANDKNRELIYKEPDLALPLNGYVSTKKVVARGINSSAFFRTSSMIAKPGIDWYNKIAGYLLETVYASSGRRFARQYPPLDSQPGWWTEISGGLLIYETKQSFSSNSVAAFDLDGTIIKTRSGNKYPVNESDWMFLSLQVEKKIKKNKKDGINNVIMSNQRGIGLGYQNKTQWMNKIENITSQLGVPMFVLAATDKNSYRKPDIGMWKYYKCTLNQFKDIDMNTAVYVGNAAGRPGDHNNSDKKFAENIGIAFYTPEQYFEAKHTEL